MIVELIQSKYKRHSTRPNTTRMTMASENSLPRPCGRVSEKKVLKLNPLKEAKKVLKVDIV